MSRTGPGSPAEHRAATPALWAASAPRRSSRWRGACPGRRGRAGSRSPCRPRTTQTVEGPGGQLVEPVVAAEDQRRAAASGETPAMTGAIRGSATPTACAPGRAGLSSGPRKLNTVGMPSSRRAYGRVPHPRVKERGEAEGDADLLGDPRGLLRRQGDHAPQLLQDVRGTGGGRGRPATVLDHPRPGGRRDDRRPWWRC